MLAAASDSRFWDRIARKYASFKIGDAAGYERTISRTTDHLKRTDRVLEFGCGTGTTALRIAPHVEEIVASDISGEMLAIGRERAAAAGAAKVEFVLATLDDRCFAPASFDAVLGFNVLHLVRDLPGALRSARAILKPNGLFISKTPCLGDMNPLVRLLVPAMQLVGKAPHVSFFKTVDLEREILAAGFEILKIERHGTKGKDARPFIVARPR